MCVCVCVKVGSCDLSGEGKEGLQFFRAKKMKQEMEKKKGH